MTYFFHVMIVEKQLITHDILHTVSDLQFSPYVPIQLISVGVERSNKTSTGTSRLGLGYLFHVPQRSREPHIPLFTHLVEYIIQFPGYRLQ